MADNEMTVQMLHILLTKEILSDKWQKVIEDAIAVLKEREEIIDNLKNTVLELNQHIKDMSEYMTPYGKVKDIKAYADMMKMVYGDQGTIVGELVRCKDCIHADISASGLIKCQGRFRQAEWYCADGKKQE